MTCCLAAGRGRALVPGIRFWMNRMRYCGAGIFPARPCRVPVRAHLSLGRADFLHCVFSCRSLSAGRSLRSKLEGRRVGVAKRRGGCIALAELLTRRRMRVAAGRISETYSRRWEPGDIGVLRRDCCLPPSRLFPRWHSSMFLFRLATLWTEDGW